MSREGGEGESAGAKEREREEASALLRGSEGARYDPEGPDHPLCVCHHHLHG